MRTLNNYLIQSIKISQGENILERLKLNKDIKLRTYNYHPENFNELRSLIEDLLEKRGKDADLNDIDVSNITTFYNKNRKFGLFQDLDPHNIKIDQWDVSNVENMRYMFYKCQNFNSDLLNWKVNKVEDMGYMFYGCKNFNSDLSKWDVSNVKYNMDYMFFGCENFNSNLSKWNVSNVKNMYGMFYKCQNFNSNLSNWKVNKVEDMRIMFYKCQNFNSDLSKWDVSKVKNMQGMFYGCTNLKNKPNWYKNR